MTIFRIFQAFEPYIDEISQCTCIHCFTFCGYDGDFYVKKQLSHGFYRGKVACIFFVNTSWQAIFQLTRPRKRGGTLARHEGFEPPAFWSVARRSIQLS